MGVCSVGFDAFSYVFCIQGNIFISLLEFTYRAWGSVHNIFVWNTLHSSVVEYCGKVQWYAIRLAQESDIWQFGYSIRYLAYVPGKGSGTNREIISRGEKGMKPFNPIFLGRGRG